MIHLSTTVDQNSPSNGDWVWTQCYSIDSLELIDVHDICRLLGLPFRYPSVNLRLELNVRNALLKLQPVTIFSLVRCPIFEPTHGTLLNGSTSLDKSTVRMVARSITTRDTGRTTGSFMTEEERQLDHLALFAC